jgi:hypothetical protein
MSVSLGVVFDGDFDESLGDGNDDDNTVASVGGVVGASAFALALIAILSSRRQNNSDDDEDEEPPSASSPAPPEISSREYTAVDGRSDLLNNNPSTNSLCDTRDYCRDDCGDPRRKMKGRGTTIVATTRLSN